MCLFKCDVNECERLKRSLDQALGSCMRKLKCLLIVIHNINHFHIFCVPTPTEYCQRLWMSLFQCMLIALQLKSSSSCSWLERCFSINRLIYVGMFATQRTTKDAFWFNGFIIGSYMMYLSSHKYHHIIVSMSEVTWSELKWRWRVKSNSLIIIE